MHIQHITELFSFDDRDFVIEAYRTLLNREPDEGGLRYYLGRLAQGHDRQSVIVQLGRSPEAGDLSHIRGLAQLISRERFRQSWLGKLLLALGLYRTQKSPDGFLRPMTGLAEQLHRSSTAQVELAASLKRWGAALDTTIDRLASENRLVQAEPVVRQPEMPLSRGDVIQTFRQVLRRNPESEAAIQAQRGHASVEALSAHLRQSAEFQSRQESLCIPARRAYAMFCTALPVTDLEN